MRTRNVTAKMHAPGTWVVSETWRTIAGRKRLWLLLWRVEDDETPGVIIYESIPDFDPHPLVINEFRDTFNRDHCTTVEAQRRVKEHTQLAMKDALERVSRRLLGKSHENRF